MSMKETYCLENKTILKVPEAYLPLLEDIRLLTADQNNPNHTTLKQQEQIWRSLQKYGWAYPIITNKDGVYADGEQRLSLIHISEPTRLGMISYAVFCLKKQ